MGTRADFYVGRGSNAEWLGSIAWDGYRVPDWLAGAKSEHQYRGAVARLLSSRDDATIPSMGWPWPWEDSNTTDYAYAFFGGRIRSSCFGGRFEAPNSCFGGRLNTGGSRKRKRAWPCFRRDSAAMEGPRSGLIVLRSA